MSEQKQINFLFRRAEEIDTFARTVSASAKRYPRMEHGRFLMSAAHKLHAYSESLFDKAAAKERKLSMPIQSLSQQQRHGVDPLKFVAAMVSDGRRNPRD